MKSSILSLALFLTAKIAASAAFDAGTPSEYTPYDRYMSPVRTVLSHLNQHKPSMEQVKKFMIEGRNFRYRMENPYVAAMPETTASKRSGDCKDKALWLCSQLGDSDVRFVIGKTAPGVRISHAWVMWKNEGRWWLLDCTLRSAPIAADELPSNRYIPLYSYSKGSNYRHAATQVGIAQVASKHKAPVASNRRS
ncbi:MAG: transglutaminase domain-containing protein [Chthoniobacteraceae bacterium]